MAASLLSLYWHEHASSRGLTLADSSAATQRGESVLWSRSMKCVPGANAAALRLLALDGDGVVIGASHFNEQGIVTALAVLPEHRGNHVGKLIIAATLAHFRQTGLKEASLYVLACDAGLENHTFYTSCGFTGGNARHGGAYQLGPIPGDIEQQIMDTRQSR